ncbi:MAG: hypothetical protein Q7S28_04265 [bacterium]|nr:hypothetical protein [bacterium]
MNQTLKRSIGVLGWGFILAQSLLPAFAHAASPCDLRAVQQQLQGAKMTNDSDSLETIRAALTVRKTILKTLIVCGHDDAVLLRDTVQALSLHDERLKALQQTLVSKLNDAIASYDIYISKVDGVGIRGSQDIARSLLTWRKEAYVPLEARALHVIIWANNQDIFDKAGKRIVQLSQTMRSLSLIDNEEINDTFAKAQTSFRAAERANENARALLLQNSPVSDELPTIKRSLELLAETYAQLFHLSSILGR